MGRGGCGIVCTSMARILIPLPDTDFATAEMAE
jgi:hypothetical protein